MRLNLPVTDQEHLLRASDLLVSTTDRQGRITHCNQAFVDVSGYDYDELIGQPHNIVRHPDMPAEAFKDLWTSVGHGRPWTGVVKNRRKTGEYYWVEANVTPIMEDGKPCGYMSVRLKPSREQVAAAQAAYARLVEQRTHARPGIALHLGRLRRVGWRDLPQRLHRLTLTHRVGAGLAAMVAASVVAALLRLPAIVGALLPALAGALLLAWLHVAVTLRLRGAERFAADLASCNLRTALRREQHGPVAAMSRSLWQIQVNLRAVMGDVRTEVAGTVDAAADIAQGSAQLASRTESQASSLQQTAASMEELSGTVQNNTQAASGVAASSEATTAASARSHAALADLAASIEAIDASSRRAAAIIAVIEGVAFQTNILALNAAIEAARAGEQGRGFAVVASEVRGLAQRSADAASEIRSLLDESSRHAGEGVERMTHARTTIDAALDSVHRVDALIRQIETATHEQAKGIAQVNEAVIHLDGVTQQNAALVDQSSAAAHALRRRSATLERSVDVFRMT